MRSLDFKKGADGYLKRPDRARACDFITDFERIGRRSLDRPEWKGRPELFNIYFVREAVPPGRPDGGCRGMNLTMGIANWSVRAAGNFSRTGVYTPGVISIHGEPDQ